MALNLRSLLVVGALLVHSAGYAAEPVTVDNFVRAETDMTLDRYVKQGAFGNFYTFVSPRPSTSRMSSA